VSSLPAPINGRLATLERVVRRVCSSRNQGTLLYTKLRNHSGFGSFEHALILLLLLNYAIASILFPPEYLLLAVVHPSHVKECTSEEQVVSETVPLRTTYRNEA
jgi:hypothetical protein